MPSPACWRVRHLTCSQVLLAVAIGSIGAYAGACSRPKPDPPHTAAGPAALTVQDVIKLAQAGIPEDIIAGQLRKNHTTFDLSTDQILQLKSASVSDRIIRVMLDPSQPDGAPAAPPSVLSEEAPNTEPAHPAAPVVQPGTPAVRPRPAGAGGSAPQRAAPVAAKVAVPAPAPLPASPAPVAAPPAVPAASETPASPPAPAPSPAAAAAPTGAVAGALPAETGVYARKAGQWVEVTPEIVRWKTGGVAKTVATLGIIKGNLNGHVSGTCSPNAYGAPDFLIVTLEGVSIAEYQLVRMHVGKEGREFRTVTGGVFHSESGATRDLVRFQSTRLSSHAFRIVFPAGLQPGEYGFLPPGSTGASGKVYSFTVTE